ncbi:MAG TPA: Asp-tRNA(Asn)/Glu-tRNA(Gln) amidotransferase subunit GatC [Firmicutes bacterium]|jgi:aspartyl-tRNA(Asn)/glutamyl-tRNA(Gln) amidotransferase subunit C|nr:Asp-tRNA(Asn)/Glu-tRNA(Gln) amidotransferase subunit GatC [Bacillota bacterium]
MKIAVTEVEYVAHLARLALDEEEKVGFTRQLNDILTHMDRLSRLDTEGVPPTYHAIDMKNVFRADQTRTWLSRAEALANAPDQENGCVKVPRVVEE